MAKSNKGFKVLKWKISQIGLVQHPAEKPESELGFEFMHSPWASYDHFKNEVLVDRAIKTFFSGKFFWSRAVAGFEPSIPESVVKFSTSVLLPLTKSIKGFKEL